MGVDLGGCNIFVPKQFLYGSHVVTVLQQPRGKTVAKGVSFHRFADGYLRSRACGM